MASTPKGLLQILNLVTETPGKGLRHKSGRAANLQRVREIVKTPNVIGLGISEKTSQGKVTGEISLCFYVKRKIPPKRIRGDVMIPPLISGYGNASYLTDVKEIGQCRLHAGAQHEIRSGISVSHARDRAGTLGAIVTKGNKLFVLSNSHVLALSGKARLGDPIISPGATDGGRLPSDLVATLTAFVPFDRQGDNVADAAIAQILPNRVGDVRAEIPNANRPIRTLAAQRGMRVAKLGKSTQDTTGRVIDVNFRISLRYPHNVGLLRFVNQVLCTQFADGGDSGSLVVDVDTGKVVGLHFAGSESVSIFNPIGPVIEALDVSFHS